MGGSGSESLKSGNLLVHNFVHIYACASTAGLIMTEMQHSGHLTRGREIATLAEGNVAELLEITNCSESDVICKSEICTGEKTRKVSQLA